MNAPLNRSRYGKGFDANYDRIFKSDGFVGFKDILNPTAKVLIYKSATKGYFVIPDHGGHFSLEHATHVETEEELMNAIGVNLNRTKI